MTYVKDILYLGSQSIPRQKLLHETDISFIAISHTSDEQIIKNDISFDQYVMKIAQKKMNHLCLPEKPVHEKNYRYVLTADTLVHNRTLGTILEKPKDLQDAKNMIRAMCNKSLEVVTGCCLQKQIYIHNKWTIEIDSTWATGALIEFNIDEEFIDIYFAKEPSVLETAGACTIDSGYGQAFFKSINGSYSAVIGLPLFELRHELKKMGFLF